MTVAPRGAITHQNPLVSGRVAGGQAYPETSYSLLQVPWPDLFVWAVKPSEEGIERGMDRARVNMAHRAVQGDLACARPVAGAKQATHLETDLDDVGLVNGTLPVALAPQQIKTFRLLLPRGK